MYRRYRIPAVYRDLDRIQREMNRIFEAYDPIRRRTAPSFPAVNIWSNEDGMVITAEVPGVNPEDIEINVVGETLNLSGTRKVEELAENTRYHRQERGYGKFNRAIQLPFPVEIEKVNATFKNGVLSVNLPRAAADKPKRITVKAA